MEENALLGKSLEDSKLARIGRLRRARLLQPNPDATLLATPPPSYRRLVGARRRPRARCRMRFQSHRAEPQQRDWHGFQLRQASLPAPLWDAAGQCLRIRTAVQR